MSWSKRYWDMVYNFYWNPHYMGFQSIQPKALEQSDGELRVPLSLVNPTGPLYTRAVKYDNMAAKLNGKEEVLGHLFNITFAIAPDALITHLFASPLDISDAGSFSTLGQQDVIDRYNLAGKHIGQHDALFLSEQTAIAVELKTGSLPSVKQILKYLALFGRMSQTQQSLTNFGLLFVCPEKDASKMLAACGIPTGTITPDFIEKNINSVNPHVQHELNSCRSHLVALLGHLRVNVITWSGLHERLCMERKGLKQREPAQQSVFRLLNGFIQQLEAHANTGIEEDQIKKFRPMFSNREEMREWIQKLSDPDLNEVDRRKALIAYVCSTSWGLNSVIDVCKTSTMVELESFVAALKDKQSPISLKFRWASDYSGGPHVF